MAFTLTDHWVWDFWLAYDGARHHAFYLHARRNSPDPDLRHQQARIGHAVSADLRGWEERPRPLAESAPGSRDDRATWTGSTIRDHEGLWHLFYTGVSSAEDGQVQRIFSATSADLATWRRTEVLVEADPDVYEKWTPELPEEHWRDPWVHWDATADVWRMFITARIPHGPSDGRGVIAQATSPDLVRWTIGLPVTEPGELRQLEVPQLIEVPGGFALMFCHGAGDNSAARLARPGVSALGGTHLRFAATPEGPFGTETDQFFLSGAPPAIYAPRLVEHDGHQYLLGWPNTADGDFAGGISDPIRFAVGPDRAVHLGDAASRLS